MVKHIGIVGCSAEGAALCYKTICVEAAHFLGPHAHPEISMHTPSLVKYVRCLNNDDLEGVGELMLNSARKISAIGADILICPDNTIHQAFHYIEKKSPKPWLHIAETVAKKAMEKGYRRVGLLGTAWLVNSTVYDEKFHECNIDVLKPNNEEREMIGKIIMDELVNGMFKKESIKYFQKVINSLKKEGCDAVILGCTEIPLIINDKNSSLPTLDSTRLLARAALQNAIE